MLYTLTYYIDKDKVEDYIKYAKEVVIPFWLSAPGLKEFRAYRMLGTSQALVEMDFESFKAWGKVMDDPKAKDMFTKFSTYTHDLKWTLWDTSPMMPEPLKPK